MTETFTIYGLQDPRTREFRYVGASTDAAARLKRHILHVAANTKQAGTAAKRAWLTDLADQGLEPYLVIFGVVEGKKAAIERERQWIARLAGEGEPLTNREAHLGRYRAPSILGSLLFEFAEKRGVLGVGEIANYIERRTGKTYSHHSVSSYVNGRTDPKPQFIMAFSQTFGLDYVECTRLSWIFAFDEEPPATVLDRARQQMEAGKSLPYQPLAAL